MFTSSTPEEGDSLWVRNANFVQVLRLRVRTLLLASRQPLAAADPQQGRWSHRWNAGQCRWVQAAEVGADQVPLLGGVRRGHSRDWGRWRGRLRHHEDPLRLGHGLRAPLLCRLRPGWAGRRLLAARGSSCRRWRADGGAQVPPPQ